VSFGYLPRKNAPVGDETVIELATAIVPEYTSCAAFSLKAWEAIILKKPASGGCTQ